MRPLVFVYILEEVAHTHARNAPQEWFSSTSGLGVTQRLLSEICWAQYYPVIDIRDIERISSLTKQSWKYPGILKIKQGIYQDFFPKKFQVDLAK